jgi:hypothetical protein
VCSWPCRRAVDRLWRGRKIRGRACPTPGGRAAACLQAAPPERGRTEGRSGVPGVRLPNLRSTSRSLRLHLLVLYQRLVLVDRVLPGLKGGGWNELRVLLRDDPPRLSKIR